MAGGKLVSGKNDKKRIGSDMPRKPFATACGKCGCAHEGIHSKKGS